jgi:hypothetical protein
LVVHVIPFSAFDLRPPFSLQSALENENWQKFSHTQPIMWRINFDGFLTLTDVVADNRKHLTDISRMNPELEADYSDFLRFPEVPPPFVAGCAQSGPGMAFPGPV